MQDTSRKSASTSNGGQVWSRAAVRISILSGLAAARSQPFWPVLANLLLVGAGLAAALATGRRERPLGPELTHWDEAAYYALFSLGLDLANDTLSTAAG